MTPQSIDHNGQVVTFYSYKGGTGRTMALANVAWILAASGKSVLVVDWDLEAPGLDRFLEPFLPPESARTGCGVIHMISAYREALKGVTPEGRRPGAPDELIERSTALGPHVIDLNWDHFPAGGRLSYLPAGHVGWDYSRELSEINWTVFYTREYGKRFLLAMREAMTREYDYVLIDSRTGLSDVAGICTLDLPDTLVVCFTLSGQGIDGAAEVARDVRRDLSRTRRVLPVPMRIDEGEHDKAEAGKALARNRFDGLPSGRSAVERDAYWSRIPFPYQPFYAYEEMPAVFGDRPGDPRSLLAACERLTGEITEGEVVRLPEMDEDLRLTWRGRYTRRLAEPASVVLAHLPEDQHWALWLREVLEESEYQVSTLPIVDQVPQPDTPAQPGGAAARPAANGGETVQPDEQLKSAPRVVSVVSRAFQDSAAAEGFRARVAGLPATGELPRELSVLVGGARLESGRAAERLDLTQLNQRDAVRALLQAMNPRHNFTGNEAARVTARYPGAEPEITNLPVRNRTFTGRAEEFARLRAQLRGGEATALLQATPSQSTQALHGMGGVGKTQLAKEYAWRYRFEYDVIWWVAADQRDLIPVELGNLAQRIDAHRMAEEGPGASPVAAPNAAYALDALRRGYPSKHWLLIFDNAGEPEDLTGFLPGGSGHVIITSRNPAWSGVADPINLDVFPREESIRHLLFRVPRLTREQANDVAEQLGDLPLAIEQSAAWLDTTGTPVPEYLDMLHRELPPLLAAGKANEYPNAVARTWNISVETLRQEAPAAARMLELCAFFAPEPIAMDLLYDRELRRELSQVDDAISDRATLGTVFEQLGKYSLARIDNQHSTVQLHRLVQVVVRSSLEEDAQEERRRRVHQVLTAGRARIEGDVDNEANWPELDRIWPHLTPSQARTSRDDDARELMVDWVRYLWLRGEFDRANTIGSDLLRTWGEQFGENDRVTLALRRELGNVLRSTGRYREALEMDQETLGRQRRVSGPEHVHALISAGNVGGDLRALGRYQEALTQDEQTLQSLTNRLGPDHVRTLRMANNVALDHRLLGDYQRARGLDQQTWERRVRVLGADAPETLISESHLVRDLRDAGQIAEAVRRLERIRERMANAQGPNNLRTLVICRNLAVSYRLAGQSENALTLIRDTAERCREQYGENNPDTRTSQLTLAAEEWMAGRHREAVDLAREVHAFFAAQLGPEHPNTLGSADNLAVFLSSESLDRESRLEALDLHAATVRQLEERLGDQHPFTICSTINWANTLAGHGRWEEARGIGELALDRATAWFGESHLDRAVCAANLSLVLAELGEADRAERTREEAMTLLFSLLGDADHPEYTRAQKRKRLSRILELQPW
ncbi:FxSxx-COOH system tetratricopeptide repeat protein [Phaeacidiphilus oryzae]|uniref:FxSxx-COOH system tetratricopeptide repeat protein n=1 Tax=Phaeacidiphilus oryzae TaxID=348818 RepID=UPI000569EE3B|nr:FxSxx-COOH system tetratricopeptide repeat protein [Phaeacidiphilus oryzae]